MGEPFQGIAILNKQEIPLQLYSALLSKISSADSFFLIEFPSKKNNSHLLREP